MNLRGRRRRKGSVVSCRSNHNCRPLFLQRAGENTSNCKGVRHRVGASHKVALSLARKLVSPKEPPHQKAEAELAQDTAGKAGQAAHVVYEQGAQRRCQRHPANEAKQYRKLNHRRLCQVQSMCKGIIPTAMRCPAEKEWQLAPIHVVRGGCRSSKGRC